MAKRSRGRDGWAYRRMEISRRLCDVAGDLSLRELGAATGANHETIRRYLDSGNPSVEFLRNFSTHFGVSADWVLGLSERGGPRGKPKAAAPRGKRAGKKAGGPERGRGGARGRLKRRR